MNATNNPGQEMPLSVEERAEIEPLIDKLLKLAEEAPTHRMFLITLLSVYQAVAMAHPCCTKTAGSSALHVGGDLLMRALGISPSERPTGPTH